MTFARCKSFQHDMQDVALCVAALNVVFTQCKSFQHAVHNVELCGGT